MEAPRRKKKKPFTRSQSLVPEWVGGRFPTPMVVSDGEPYNPDIDLWIELPLGVILTAAILKPSNPERSFTETLRHTMENPTIGPPRRPRRVRIADKLLAVEIRDAFPDIDVVVAETPELEEILQDLIASLYKGSH